MTTIYTDTGTATRFFGECSYGNYSIFYPAKNWFKCTDELLNLDSFLAQSTQANALTIEPNLKFWYDSEELAASSHLFSFKLKNDLNQIQNKRFSFNINHSTGTASITGYQDDGLTQFFSQSLSLTQVSLTKQKLQFTLSCSPNSLSLFIIYYDDQYNIRETLLLSVAIIQNLNQNQGYYLQDPLSKFAILLSNSTQTKVYHRINNQNKLTKSDYEYAIVCNDGQAPFSKWLTSFLLFEDNLELGDPCIGLYPDFLIGTGTFTIGKKTTITGGVTPAPSLSQNYIPVCKYSTSRTILMKVL